MNHLTQTQTPVHPLNAALEHLRTAQPQTLLERSRVLLSPVFRPLTALQAQAVFSAWTLEQVN